MRKLLTFLIALGAIAFGVCSPAGAQFNGCGPGLCSPGGVYAYGYGFQGGCGGYNSACASAPPAFSLTYQSIANSTATTALVDMGTMTYGSGNTRVIIAIGTLGGSSTISAVTVNGVSATAVSGATASQGGNYISSIWMTNSAVAGSSGDVQITFTGSIFGNTVAALYNLVTTTPAPSSGVGNTGSGSPLNQAITVPAGGGAVVIANAYGAGGAVTGSLTNATVDGSFGNGTAVSSVANVGHTTSTGSVTVSGNVSPSGASNISIAAWGP